MLACCQRNSAPNGWRSSRICLTSRAKGALRIKRWVDFWYCRISRSAKFPGLWRLGVDCFLRCVERGGPPPESSSVVGGGAERGFGVLFSRAFGPFRWECYVKKVIPNNRKINYKLATVTPVGSGRPHWIITQPFYHHSRKARVLFYAGL